MKTYLLFSKLVLVLCFTLGDFRLGNAQKFNEEKVSTSYIQMPLKRLPEDIQTYEGKIRVSVRGQFYQDERSLLNKCSLADYQGYQRVEQDGDIYLEVIYESGLVFENVELVKDERSYMEKFINEKGKEDYRYPKFTAYYYRIRYKTAQWTARLVRRDGTVLEEKVGGGTYASENYGYGTNPSTSIPPDNFLSEEPLKKSWDLAKERILVGIESKGIAFPCYSFAGYFPNVAQWNAEIEVIREGKEPKYQDYREAVNAYLEGLSYVKTDKIVKINKIIRPDYEKRVAAFKKAIEIWEKMLTEPRERKDRMNDKIAANICLNLTSAYLWIGNYSKAREYLEMRKMGSRKDKSEVGSLGDEISDFEFQAKANDWRPLLTEDKDPFVYTPKITTNTPTPIKTENANSAQKATTNTMAKSNASPTLVKSNTPTVTNLNNTTPKNNPNNQVAPTANQNISNTPQSNNNTNSNSTNNIQSTEKLPDVELLNLRPWILEEAEFGGEKKDVLFPFFVKKNVTVFFPNKTYQVYASSANENPGKSLEEGTWSIEKSPNGYYLLNWKGKNKLNSLTGSTQGKLKISNLDDKTLLLNNLTNTQLLKYSITTTLPERGELLGVLDDLKIPKGEENPLANFVPNIKTEGSPAKIHIYRPKFMVRKGTFYDVQFNGKPICSVGDGDRFIYELYSEGALDFKIKINGGTKVLESKESILNTFNGLQGKPNINTNSNSLSPNNSAGSPLIMGLDGDNPNVQKATALVNTANILTEATTKLTNKDEQLTIQKGQNYYLRIDGATGNLKLSKDAVDATEDFNKAKKFDGEIQTLKEILVSPIPGMSLWDEVQRQKDEYLAKYEAEQTLKAQKRKAQANTNLLTAKPWYFQGTSKVPKEGETLKPTIANACYKDNTLQFTSDNKYQIRDGKLKCYGVVIDQDATWEWLPEQAGVIVKKGQTTLFEAKIVSFKDSELIMDINNLANKTQTRVYYAPIPAK
jgi:hypothetical protein